MDNPDVMGISLLCTTSPDSRVAIPFLSSNSPCFKEYYTELRESSVRTYVEIQVHGEIDVKYQHVYPDIRMYTHSLLCGI